MFAMPMVDAVVVDERNVFTNKIENVFVIDLEPGVDLASFAQRASINPYLLRARRSILEKSET